MNKLALAALLALPLTLSAQIIKWPISTEYPYPEVFKTPQNAPEIPVEIADARLLRAPGRRQLR